MSAKKKSRVGPRSAAALSTAKVDPALKAVAKSDRNKKVKDTAPRQEDKPKRGRGRPPIHAEKWMPVTVSMFPSELVELRRLENEIFSRTGKTIKRAEIIRAMVDATMIAIATNVIDLNNLTPLDRDRPAGDQPRAEDELRQLIHETLLLGATDISKDYATRGTELARMLGWRKADKKA